RTGGIGWVAASLRPAVFVDAGVEPAFLDAKGIALALLGVEEPAADVVAAVAQARTGLGPRQCVAGVLHPVAGRPAGPGDAVRRARARSGRQPRVRAGRVVGDADAADRRRAQPIALAHAG